MVQTQASDGLAGFHETRPYHVSERRRRLQATPLDSHPKDPTERVEHEPRPMTGCDPLLSSRQPRVAVVASLHYVRVGGFGSSAIPVCFLLDDTEGVKRACLVDH
jgi:hypothetical protein